MRAFPRRKGSQQLRSTGRPQVEAMRGTRTEVIRKQHPVRRERMLDVMRDPAGPVHEDHDNRCVFNRMRAQ